MMQNHWLHNVFIRMQNKPGFLMVDKVDKVEVVDKGIDNGKEAK